MLITGATGTQIMCKRLEDLIEIKLQQHLVVNCASVLMIYTHIYIYIGYFIHFRPSFTTLIIIITIKSRNYNKIVYNKVLVCHNGLLRTSAFGDTAKLSQNIRKLCQ